MFGSLFLMCKQVHLCHILDSTYKWYHMLFVFLFWLTELTIILRSIHVTANGNVLFFFLRLNNILHLLNPFICQWTFRLLPCLGCCKQCCYEQMGHKYLLILESLSFSDICPAVGLLDHRVALFLIFKETSILFCIGAAEIYITTNSVEGFHFLHTLSSIYYLQTFWRWTFWLVWGDTSWSPSAFL